MPKLIFTPHKTEHSIGYIGGSAENIPVNLWPKIPNSENYQTHIFTLYSAFLPENVFPRRNLAISIFCSIEKHALGGVKESISSKYTVNQKNDINILNQGYSSSIIYELCENHQENLSPISLKRKYFERLDVIDPVEAEKYDEQESLFFEDNGMGLDISKIFGIPYFEQDIIYPPPKFDFGIQLLEEDIDDQLCIFQHGIGYFFYDKGVGKKLKSGDNAGLFFIQNT
jgi:hypothetical protein